MPPTQTPGLGTRALRKYSSGWRGPQRTAPDRNIPDPIDGRINGRSPPRAFVPETFRTSRLLDFSSQRELTAQIGHEPEWWPAVIVKELVDNALDAAEQVGAAPRVRVTATDRMIEVVDNGPGIPGDVIDDILDFSVRVSSREAYVGPWRGAQGNALKTIW